MGIFDIYDWNLVFIKLIRFSWPILLPLLVGLISALAINIEKISTKKEKQDKHPGNENELYNYTATGIENEDKEETFEDRFYKILSPAFTAHALWAIGSIVARSENKILNQYVILMYVILMYVLLLLWGIFLTVASYSEIIEEQKMKSILYWTAFGFIVVRYFMCFWGPKI